MTRVCLYLRISTDEDHQPTSLGTQRERLERYCQAMEDWHVVHAFEDQASGVKLDRPGLEQALGLARERRFDLLLVYRVDRLSRKVRQLAGLAEELDRLGIVFKSATDEPLVAQELFERTQQILRRRGENASPRRVNPSDFLLSGLVRCEHCGRAYVGTSAHGRNNRYTYYACSTRYKYGPSKCNGERLPKDRLEAAVLSQLAGLYRDGRLIERALANAATLATKERPRFEEQ
ncbi:MAG: recombinase family protein, partial [Gaiellaceae bacterium]